MDSLPDQLVAPELGSRLSSPVVPMRLLRQYPKTPKDAPSPNSPLISVLRVLPDIYTDGLPKMMAPSGADDGLCC